MKILGFTFFVFATALLNAQPVFPPVPGGDVERSDYGLWNNTGWLLDTDGDPRPDVQFVRVHPLAPTSAKKLRCLSQ